MPPNRTGRTNCAQALTLQGEGIPIARIGEIARLAIPTIFHIEKNHFNRLWSREFKNEHIPYEA